VLERQFIGSRQDQLKLKFLHGSRCHRRKGLGRTLFEKAVAGAWKLGARRLYVLSVPPENAVDFYLHMGCRECDCVDPALFEPEPDDIHLEYEIPESPATIGDGREGNAPLYRIREGFGILPKD
jgi:hypothetical protein